MNQNAIDATFKNQSLMTILRAFSKEDTCNRKLVVDMVVERYGVNVADKMVQSWIERLDRCIAEDSSSVVADQEFKNFLINEKHPCMLFVLLQGLDQINVREKADLQEQIKKYPIYVPRIDNLAHCLYSNVENINLCKDKKTLDDYQFWGWRECGNCGDYMNCRLCRDYKALNKLIASI